MNARNFIDSCGDSVLWLAVAACVILVVPIGAIIIPVVLILEGLDYLQSRRLLGPITVGVLIGLVLIHLPGCATAPAPVDNDPVVWRPKNPVYPLPQ